MLTLYTAPATCALASHLALEFAGADYQVHKLDFKKSEQQSPDYLRVNPKARVPALATPQGIVTETPAILQYIAQTHPAARLAPVDDSFAMGKINEFDSYLCATVHVAHAHRPRAYRWADDEAAQAAMRAKVPQNMAESFEYIERDLLRGPWVMGEAITICDFYLFTVSGWLAGDGVDIARFPKVARHRTALAGDPRAARVMASY